MKFEEAITLLIRTTDLWREGTSCPMYDYAMNEGKYRAVNVQRRGSHHRGKSTRPFLRQRHTVKHRRLVNDVVEPRTWDIILKGKRT